MPLDWFLSVVELLPFGGSVEELGVGAIVAAAVAAGSVVGAPAGGWVTDTVFGLYVPEDVSYTHLVVSQCPVAGL